MKKFNSVLEQYLKDNVDLIKIRLRVDPKNKYGRDFRDFDGYEGYILKEGDYTSVIIENCDLPIMSVPMSIISIVGVSGSNAIESVKNRALKELKNRGKLTAEILTKIKNIESLDFLDQYLKSEGLDDSNIKKILMNSIRNEAIDWRRVATAGKKMIKTGVKAGAIAAGVALAPGMVANKLAGKARRGVENYMSGDSRPDFEGKYGTKVLADANTSKRILDIFNTPGSGWRPDSAWPNSFIRQEGGEKVSVFIIKNLKQEITALDYTRGGISDADKSWGILNMDQNTIKEISNPPSP